MRIFSAVVKAVVDTALMVTVDPLVSFKEAMDGEVGENSCTKRARKIADDLKNAHDETFDD